MTLDELTALLQQHAAAAPKADHCPPGLDDLLAAIAGWMDSGQRARQRARGSSDAGWLRHLIMESEVVIQIMEAASGSLHDRLSDMGEDLNLGRHT